MIEQYRHILTQPYWQSSYDLLPLEKQAWLLHQGSLTKKLMQTTKQLNVEIIQQGWQIQNPTYREWKREVLLKDGNTAWIFAQTLIPKITISTVAQRVLTLGNEPIGLWLFAQMPHRLTLEWQQDQTTKLYTRRSTYLLNGYPLEIREIFLNAFPFI